MNSITRSLFACALAILLSNSDVLSTAVAQTGDWPQWRGSDRSNASQETNLLKEWPVDGPPLLWSVTGLGQGIHSVSVAAGRVFTVGNRDGGEYAFALDVKTGQKLWATRMGDAIDEDPRMRWLTQRTPTIDGDLVYTLSANGELFCMGAADGHKVWQRNYPSEFGSSPHWGHCDRPLVDGDRLVCTPFGTTAIIAALDKRTGKTIWQTRPTSSRSAGDAALIASDACGVRQYIVFDSLGLSGFAAEDGQLLWNYPRHALTAESYTPIVDGDYIYSPNGYHGGLIGIQLTREEGRFVVLDHYQIPLEFVFHQLEDSTAHVGDYLYAISRRLPVCIELRTGMLCWTGDLPVQVGLATLTYANSCLYLRDASGTMSLIQVSPQEGKITGAFKIPNIEESFGVTAPVVAGGRLYLRDSSRLFCYNISADAFIKPPPEPLQATFTLTAEELKEKDRSGDEPRVGIDRAPDAVFISTPQDIVERMLQEAGVKQGDVVVDLGSGDGRIVITAAKKYGCKAVGYEIDPNLVELSRKAVAKENLEQLVKIEHADIFTVDLSGADVITTFLYPRLMERLIPQFEKLKAGSRIVSHQFDMPSLKPDRTLTVESNETGGTHHILLWTAPLRKQ